MGRQLLIRGEIEMQAYGLYKEGMMDREIGERIGLSGATVWAWRERNELPCLIEHRGKGNLLSAEEERRRVALWGKGLADEAIGKRFGVTRAAIHSWRKRRGLSARRPFNKLLESEELERRKLYRQGLTDGEMAKALGVAQHVTCRWRRHRKLAVNRVVFETKDEAKRIELYNQGLSDVTIARELNYGRATTICSWRKRRGLKRNRRPGETEKFRRVHGLGKDRRKRDGKVRV